MAHKMPTTHVGCYRPAVLDGGSNPPISTNRVTARHCKLQVAGRLRCAGLHKTCSKVASFLLYQRGQKGIVPVWHGGPSPRRQRHTHSRFVSPWIRSEHGRRRLAELKHDRYLARRPDGAREAIASEPSSLRKRQLLAVIGTPGPNCAIATVQSAARNAPRFHSVWPHGPLAVRVHAWLGGHNGARSRGLTDNRVARSALR